jgi:hypothetical protein
MKLLVLFRKWIITLTAMLLCLLCVFITIMCLFLPDRSTNPVLGSVFYLFGAFILVSYFLLEWRNAIQIESKCINRSNHGDKKIAIITTFSIRILKWIISLYSVLFAFLCAAMASICLFGLPDGSTDHNSAIIFLFGGLLVMGVLVFLAWRNWISSV